MIKCLKCDKEITNDCQFIKGKWYHNNCIEDLQQENKQLKEEIKKLKNSKPYKILKEWEEFIENKEFNNYTDFEYKMKLIELKEKYK